MTSPEELQREYYRTTANSYDNFHAEEEHFFALGKLCDFIEENNIGSVCDVGAGTGRAMEWIKQRFPDMLVKGVEPVESLRLRGYAKGISPEDLVEGDGYSLPFPDGAFDLVCEFAVLHHVRRPEQMVAEMSRVASRSVAISDCNFMGQGPHVLRYIKVLIFILGLWPVADWIKTRGKRYTYSEGDGIAYSYSVFQSLATLRRLWKTVTLRATSGFRGSGSGLIVKAAHLLVIASGSRAPAPPSFAIGRSGFPDGGADRTAPPVEAVTPFGAEQGEITNQRFHRQGSQVG